MVLSQKKKVIEFRIIRNLLLRTWFREAGHGHAGEGKMGGEQLQLKLCYDWLEQVSKDVDSMGLTSVQKGKSEETVKGDWVRKLTAIGSARTSEISKTKQKLYIFPWTWNFSNNF